MGRTAQERGVAILRWILIVAPLELQLIHPFHGPLDSALGSMNFKRHVTPGAVDNPARFQHAARPVRKMHQGADVIHRVGADDQSGLNPAAVKTIRNGTIGPTMHFAHPAHADHTDANGTCHGTIPL
jgi:hypothetical protein